MTGQRNHSLPILAAAFTVLLSLHAWAGAPAITLPEPLAIELPDGVTTLGSDDAPMRELIGKVQADGDRVTVSLPLDRIGIGVWYVVWSAWDAESADHPAARRGAYLFVLPHGMTPVGVGGGGNAVAGNNTTHIVRDPGGSVHMVWYDAFRPEIHEGAQYRRARVMPDGSVRFETDVMQLGAHAGTWNAMPTVTAFGDTVHFAWQANGTVWYRSLTRDGDAWHWSEEVDTKVVSPGRDTGPSIAADANGVYILTPAAAFTASTDGGRTWKTEAVPFGNGEHAKTVSLALDSKGRPLAASSSVVSGPPKYSEDQGGGGFWTIRLARRTSPGVWERVPGPVDGLAEWAPPRTPNEDVLCDWVRVLEDGSGAIHVTWHGTAVSRIYAHDRAYYAWRSPEGEWRPPVPLRDPDPNRGYGFSYAPGLSLDGDRALTLAFHNVSAGHQPRGFDSDLELFHDGKSVAPALAVTRFAERSAVAGEPDSALSSWFPGAAPSLVRTPDGRVLADILVSLVPTGVPAPALIVWIRKDLTAWLKAAGQ